MMRAMVIEKLGVNVYNVLVHDLGTVWKCIANQLISVPYQEIASAPTPPTADRRTSSHIKRPPDRLEYT